MTSRADDLRFRELLTERLGAEATNTLLERLPVTPVSDLATKADLAILRGELLDEMGKIRGDIGTLRGEFGDVKGDIGTLRGEFGQLKGQFGELRGEFGELRGEFGELRADIADTMRIQTWYTAGLLVTAVGATAGIVAAIVG
ncbi:MAG TPA: hypothetical protein VM618_03175 [Acidimicrobiia bacterium]|nr:hypothetical protein [Acidimicrobiia bacterium]